MKRLVSTFIIIGYLFWGMLLFNGLLNILFYNGLYLKFKFNCIVPDSLNIEQERTNYNIRYGYNVNNHEYFNKYGVTEELYFTKIKNKQIHICYNIEHPKYSYIQEVNLSLRKHKVTIFISSVFILIIAIFGIIAKREYWIRKYKEFFRRL